MYRFVLTLWMEPDEAGEGPWRGQVKHVESGATEAFEGVERLTEAVERLCTKIGVTGHE